MPSTKYTFVTGKAGDCTSGIKIPTDSSPDAIAVAQTQAKEMAAHDCGITPEKPRQAPPQMKP